jgi:hypothetical protein
MSDEDQVRPDNVADVREFLRHMTALNAGVQASLREAAEEAEALGTAVPNPQVAVWLDNAAVVFRQHAASIADMIQSVEDEVTIVEIEQHEKRAGTHDA